MGLLNAPDAGEDAGLRALVRRVADLETQLQQVSAAAAGNSGQVDFLASQTVSAEAAPGALTTLTTNPAAADVATTWVAFDAAADAAVTITTSSTGKRCGDRGAEPRERTYTLRCRRGYAVTAGLSTSAAVTAFQGTALNVTKLGM